MRPDSSVWTTAFCCALALLASGCNSGGGGSGHTPTIIGSGVIVFDDLHGLLPFDGVDAGIGETHVVVSQGSPQSVRIETDDNIIDEIEMVVFGSALSIFSDASYSTQHGVEIQIVMPDIRTLRFDGTGEMEATGIAAPAGTLEVVFTGSGSINVAGTVDSYIALHEGMGGIDAEALTTRLADIELRGVGDCLITVTEELTGSIFGTGDILYAGNPTTVNRNIQGDGEIKSIP